MVRVVRVVERQIHKRALREVFECILIKGGLLNNTPAAKKSKLAE